MTAARINTIHISENRTDRQKLRVSANVTETRRISWPVLMIIVSLIIPVHFKAGSLLLTPYRIVLLLMFVPCLFFWLGGKAGRIRAADIALALYCAWCALSLTVLHGTDVGLETGGILIVETLGPFLIARCFVRDSADFRNLVRLLFIIVCLLFPWAVIESFFGRDLLLEMISSVASTHVITSSEPRWGLRRVQAVFEHPILFGVCCASAFALTHMVLGYGESTSRRWARSAIVAATAFLSMSAGPILALLVQAGMMCWNSLLKGLENRWLILAALGAAGATFIQIFSNQSVPAFIITYFNFDSFSAYYRILIWNYGTDSALNHPLFGVGLGEWDRPLWMPPSIDMFWLIHAIQYGIPASIFMILTVVFTIYGAIAAKGLDPRQQQYRTAYIIVLCGYIVVGFSVHFWSATYVIFLFILGSGYWSKGLKDQSGVRRRGESQRSRSIRSPIMRPARSRPPTQTRHPG